MSFLLHTFTLFSFTFAFVKPKANLIWELDALPLVLGLLVRTSLKALDLNYNSSNKV